RATGGATATGGAKSTGGATATGGAKSTSGAGGIASGGASGAPTDAGSGGAQGGTISAEHPGDQGLDSDSRVIFHSDFEKGFDGWTRHTQDASQIDVLADASLANSGTKYLRAQVTRTQLAANQ